MSIAECDALPKGSTSYQLVNFPEKSGEIWYIFILNENDYQLDGLGFGIEYQYKRLKSRR
jgi:hypothetical protein